ncbi:PREDICTED: muscle M-line assembly protein unc-89 isoform X2 [Polistes dominula]|uniref:Muscle M-line assembly protein unc-89 isoform X2 n=1 Tax=Polistes dominula TaxID=743375 RepID=A0ABM1IPV4_POLDO|nr:PREDICTED: muscle M-line assembly protein unc-89 isoform X2 [Polistes dominula]
MEDTALGGPPNEGKINFFTFFLPLSPRSEVSNMASGLPSARQRKLGPAPIASFEDLSDEVENGEPTTRMPGIIEVATPATPGSSLKTPSTPRIDISRASSSSHHEDSNSRESSPERELLAGGDPPPGCKLTLGYKEDAQDLRSSTEELDLQDPIHEQDLRRESKKARKRREDGSQSDYSGGTRHTQDRERKDSNCSEIILLNISGRTSRLSSVGSQGSGVSGKLSVVSGTSSRSPSPHKCLLETSFCGSKPTLADNLIEPSKPETEDLEKILLKREADTTKALIPESIKVSMVGGNLKPDPLDKPRRRGREERKEIFKREVEITKKFLEKVNIEQQPVKSQPQEVQKPATLDFNDKRKKAQNFKEIVQTTPTASSLTGSPKLPRHQKVRDLEGSRTPSPSSVSRKSSFASLFKTRTDGSVLSPESPSPSTKPRRSLTSKIKDTTESLRSRSKSRERVAVDKGGGSSTLKKDSKNKGVFSSTLSLFKKRERKKSYDEAIASSSSGAAIEYDVGYSVGSSNVVDQPQQQQQQQQSLESIGPVEFTFNTEKERRKDDSIFISLHADDRNYEEALPSESVSIPLETPTKLLDEYESEPRTTNTGGIMMTEVSIEHHRPPVIEMRTEARIEMTPSKRSSLDNQTIPRSPSRDSQTSLISGPSKDSKIINVKDNLDNTLIKSSTIIKTTTSTSPTSANEIRPMSGSNQRLSGSSSKDSISKRTVASEVVTKIKRKSKDEQVISSADKIDDFTSHKKKMSDISDVTKTVVESKKEFLEDSLSVKMAEVNLVKTSSVISDLDHNSSESERDSEIEFIRNKTEKISEELPDERKGLFNEESFEEDLPYIPTTLPLEKSVAVPILPVKQRLQEVRTIPIERPRSTTPINPTLLDEFVMQTSLDERRVERMKISLPREDSFKLKSPKRHAANTFSEFAGKVTDGGRNRTAGKSPSPPPLPPRAPSRPTNWINFEEIPEKRKAPKIIQTIPRTEDEVNKTTGYSYVQPEECRCECHEESRRASINRETTTTMTTTSTTGTTATNVTRTSSSCSSSNGERTCNGENCVLPTTNSSVDRASIVSDSSLECSLSIEDNQIIMGHAVVNQQTHVNSGKPFIMDLDVRSNRSSIVSQEDNDDNSYQ